MLAAGRTQKLLLVTDIKAFLSETFENVYGCRKLSAGVFDYVSHFHPSLTFVSKDGSLPLPINKRWRGDSDTHSVLLQYRVDYDRNFYSNWAQNVIYGVKEVDDIDTLCTCPASASTTSRRSSSGTARSLRSSRP